ncbi:MAG: hypothetical protein JNL70_27700 [Saprospiraceae bacterium]|nr:hypothetical protein [Saprospiraceae bacterium]
MTLSKIAYAICLVILTFANLVFYPKWQKPQGEATLSYDVCGYYYYLPAIFIYKDLKKVAFHSEIDVKYQPQGGGFYAALPSTNGNLVMKYTAGMAIMYAPAFFVAHALATPLGFAADGFSAPYQFAISFWSLLWSFFGLFYLRKLLLKLNFTEGVVASVLLLYVLTTNYLEYAAITSAMTHSYIFTLYIVMIWQTVRFYETPNFRSASIIGLCIGLAALARPTELIVMLVPALWGVSDVKTLGNRFVFVKNHFAKYLTTAVIIGLLGSIQLMYWKWASGHAIYNSYGPEDWMEWGHPHILDGLFSSRRGWLVYTPMMLFALVGFYYLYKKRRDLFWANFLFTVLFIYVSFAHNIWWYGGSLGQRQMIQTMPMLALPFACFLEKALATKGRKILLSLATVVCLYLNLWWHYQAHQGGLWRDETTQAYLRRIIGRWDVPLEAQKLLDNKYDLPFLLTDARDLQTIFEQNFEKDSSKNTEIIEGNRWLIVDAAHPTSETFNLPPLSIRGKNWLRVQATFKATVKEWNFWAMTQFIIEFKKGDQVLRSNMVRPHRLMSDGEVRTVWLDAKVPKVDFDAVTVRFWNAGGDKKMWVDNLVVQTFNQ